MKLYLSTLFLPSGLTKTDVGESTDIKSSFSIFEMAGRIRKIVFNVLSKIFFQEYCNFDQASVGRRRPYRPGFPKAVDEN